jgi:hypothetical protein
MDNKLNTVLAGIYLSNLAVQQAFHDKDCMIVVLFNEWFAKRM